MFQNQESKNPHSTPPNKYYEWSLHKIHFKDKVVIIPVSCQVIQHLILSEAS